MRSIGDMIKITFWSCVLVLSLACVATAETSTTKADQPAQRKGGQAGQAPDMEKGSVEAGSSGPRVGGQAGHQTPSGERKNGDGSVGRERVGGQAGAQSDQKKPESKGKDK